MVLWSWLLLSVQMGSNCIPPANAIKEALVVQPTAASENKCSRDVYIINLRYFTHFQLFLFCVALVFGDHNSQRAGQNYCNFPISKATVHKVFIAYSLFTSVQVV